ncbi:MAG: dienelactone hydrolase family protein [Truepera sp.]|nr:dienelactone hydrolase family protein [Truepera sp.]
MKRILSGLTVALIATVGALALSLPVDSLINRGRVERLSNLAIAPTAAGAPEVLALVAAPPGEGPFPAVIMIHEFWGLREQILGKAQALAAEGYVVVAPDTFRGQTTNWLPQAIRQSATTPQAQINTDLDAVFAWLSTQPAVDPRRIAVMGFCYGGRAALRFSLHNDRLAATGIFYGSSLITDPEVLRRLPGPVLGIFGTADRMIPLTEVRAFEEALTSAGIPHAIHLFEGQGHAFVTSIEGIRAGGAQGLAWDEFLGFLEVTLAR